MLRPASGEKSYEVVAIPYPHAVSGDAGRGSHAFLRVRPDGPRPSRGAPPLAGPPPSFGGSAGIAWAHASATALSAAITALCSSSPWIIRHGDQGVSELARRSASVLE